MSGQKDNYNPESYNAMFARIEQKLDDVSSDVKDIKLMNSDVEKRVGALENYKYYFSAIVASFTFIISWFWNKTFK
jgi:hypothetical protein